MKEKVSLRVGGLKGEAGKKEIEHNLSQVDGVEKVEVSPARHEVIITFDSERAEERRLTEILNTLGYAPLE